MLPTLEHMLPLAGFILRGKRRATCGWCSGHDQITASYTTTYVHCFRCNRTQGYLSLAKELNILNRTLSDAEHAQLEGIRKKEKRRNDFLAWQKQKINIIQNKFCTLRIRARLAQKHLRIRPSDEACWITLAKFYHQESKLLAAMDFFTMEPVSQWLEEGSTIEELVSLFNEQTRGHR
jgi:hypothetical protein